MKSAVIFTTLLILVNQSQQSAFNDLTQMWQANVLKHHDQCLKQTGADPKLALRVLPYGEYVDDHKVMCYITCILDNLTVMHIDNSIHQENFFDIMYIDLKLLGQTNITDHCFNIKLDDVCESGYRSSECVYKSLQKAIFDMESMV